MRLNPFSNLYYNEMNRVGRPIDEISDKISLGDSDHDNSAKLVLILITIIEP